MGNREESYVRVSVIQILLWTVKKYDLKLATQEIEVHYLNSSKERNR